MEGETAISSSVAISSFDSIASVGKLVKFSWVNTLENMDLATFSAFPWSEEAEKRQQTIKTLYSINIWDLWIKNPIKNWNWSLFTLDSARDAGPSLAGRIADCMTRSRPQLVWPRGRLELGRLLRSINYYSQPYHITLEYVANYMHH